MRIKSNYIRCHNQNNPINVSVNKIVGENKYEVVFHYSTIDRKEILVKEDLLYMINDETLKEGKLDENK